ncbi:hypothetical protein [Lachnoclostridium phytofermentans]|uniref:Uncharacterized protein n=1 Tax=Lachnoclostridium phytofermentans (strain ATCC 700394 / DSM 18823 / ISDg) TaxID=357809 RepID=A9KKQ8_LACP7|nr:hypothetical protein [Lachnoclostridium phytofermentans]ABX41229.1 hypothetical protein Cphy_0842 [Lachnoclostridium phytofermentans ISDg]
MHVYEKVTDLLVAFIIFFLIPMLYLGKRTDLLCQEELSGYTANFIEDVTTHGYLTKEIYEDFLDRIHRIYPVLQIEMISESYAYEPIYQKNNNTMEFTNKNQTYWTVTTNEDIINNLYSTKARHWFSYGGYFKVNLWKVEDGSKELITTCGARIRESMEY